MTATPCAPTSPDRASGAVLVVGGGVAGVQTALDCTALGLLIFSATGAANPPLTRQASAAEGTNFAKIITRFTERETAVESFCIKAKTHQPSPKGEQPCWK